METVTDLKALYIIANAGHSDEIMDIIRGAGGMGGTIVHARGEGSHHHSFLGITLDHEQEIVIFITDSGTAGKIIAEIDDKAGRETDVHGICYVMPVESAVGLLRSGPAEKQEGEVV